MKNLITIALGLLIAAGNAFATPADNTAAYSRPADHIARGSYHSIVVEDDIDLVLTESDLAGITVVANDKVKNDVRFKIVDGVLHINSTGKSLRNKAIVYVPVSNLEKLEINGQSRVTSSGILNSPLLKVIIRGEAAINLRSNGDVQVDGDEETELHIDKTYRRNCDN